MVGGVLDLLCASGALSLGWGWSAPPFLSASIITWLVQGGGAGVPLTEGMLPRLGQSLWAMEGQLAQQVPEVLPQEQQEGCLRPEVKGGGGVRQAGEGRLLSGRVGGLISSQKCSLGHISQRPHLLRNEGPGVRNELGTSRLPTPGAQGSQSGQGAPRCWLHARAEVHVTDTRAGW